MTASVSLTLLSVLAMLFRRYVLAALGFLSLGCGALALVWDGWSAKTGHHMELTALLHPVSLTQREAFLLATHGPLLAIGVALLLLVSSNRLGRAVDR
jgi:hypothetical protein